MRNFLYILLLCAIHSEVTFSKNKSQRSNTVIQTSDGGFVMAGMIISSKVIPIYPSNSMRVVKTDCQGNETYWENGACTNFIGLEELANDESFNLYPNPTNGKLTLDYFIPENSTLTLYPNPSSGKLSVDFEIDEVSNSKFIQIFDVMGQLVQTINLETNSQRRLELDCSEFSNGIYTCVLMSDGQILKSKKLVIVK